MAVPPNLTGIRRLRLEIRANNRIIAGFSQSIDASWWTGDNGGSLRHLKRSVNIRVIGGGLLIGTGRSAAPGMVYRRRLFRLVLPLSKAFDTDKGFAILIDHLIAHGRRAMTGTKIKKIKIFLR